MYNWRKLSPKQRGELLEHRKTNRLPWHSPPRRTSDRTKRYLFTAACYEHKPYIGVSMKRLDAFSEALADVAVSKADSLVAWVVLPNHYHFLAVASDALDVLSALGKLHGRTSFKWNAEDSTRGRKVWCGATETAMKSERHFWATVNCIHHNPVKHGYVEKWQDWPFGSAAQHLDSVGPDEARRNWVEYPVNEYGKDWDEF